MSNARKETLTDRCYECGNCVRCCLVQAIHIERNDFGCGTAVIDSEKCIDCGVCRKVCSFCMPVSKKEPDIAYAATSKSLQSEYSASGGIFYELAVQVIKFGGTVIGAAYDTDWNVRQTAVSEIKNLIQLQGAKYVKSNVGDSYKLAKELLETDSWVLYSGTPCQIAGLKKYLGNTVYHKLLTVDIICHGTPLVCIFQDYINYLQKKRHRKIKQFSFRCKKYGHRHIGKYTYKKGSKIKSVPLYSSESSYFSLFLQSHILNDACYKCDFTDKLRVGDITLGDFWGVRDEIPEFFTQNLLPGETIVSAVMINSQTGNVFFNEIAEHIISQGVEYKQIVNNNPRLNFQKTQDLYIYNVLRKQYIEKGYEGIE